MSQFTIPQGYQSTVSAAPKATDGNSGSLTDYVPTWNSPNTPLVITPAVDGLSAVVAVPASSAPATYHVAVVAQSQPNGPTFTSGFDVVVPPEQADHFDFSATSPAKSA